MGRKRDSDVPEGHIRWIPSDYDWMDREEPEYEKDDTDDDKDSPWETMDSQDLTSKGGGGEPLSKNTSLPSVDEMEDSIAELLATTRYYPSSDSGEPLEEEDDWDDF